MKPYVGNYGWTPQQMARVNSQRESRGQQPLLDNRMKNQDFMDQYNAYSSKPKSTGIRKSQYDLAKEKDSPSIKERIKAQTSSFDERFNKRKMLPQGMGGMRGAVSSPSMQESFSRLVS